MNVIVFALNGCPVSALGPYGNEWIGTPHLDRLAAEGVAFDRHISDRPDPAAARRAWRSGRHQAAPTVGLNPAARPDLLHSLTSRGVRTVLVRHTRPENDPPPEFADGWSEVVDARPDPADDSPGDALVRALPAVLDRLTGEWLLWVEIDRLLPPWHVPQDVFEAYIEDVEEDEDGPIEADDDSDEGEAESDDEPDDVEDEDEAEEEEDEEPVEPDDPVLPWTDPPVGWFDKDDLASWELLHTTFAAALTAFDADLGRVFDQLRERVFDRSAAWVFTADRGYPLGEHGVVGPFRPWLHEELVHVPLIVRLPDATEAGRRVFALTQPADVTATLLAWFGAAPFAADGVDLAPLMRGEVESVRPRAVSGLDLGPATEWAVRTPDWALLLPAVPHPDDDPRPPQLFEKPADPWEVNDLRSRNLETAEELERVLREAVRAVGPA